MTLEPAKAEARKAAFARRKQAFEAGGPDAVGAATARLLDLLLPYRGRPVAGYSPMRTELDPVPAMTDLARDAAVGVPIIQAAGLPLIFHRWVPGCPMVAGPFGASVPENGVSMVPQVVIVPLVAFDLSGNRLGYGGGFYDRTLQGLRARGPVFAVGYAWDAQQADDLPLEATDQPLNALVTGSRTLVF